MIVEFSVENFRSFKGKRTFSLLATKNKELAESNTFDVDNKIQLLKSAVIYGANASGKSNFFNALTFFLQFSVFSGPRKQIKDPIEIDSFALSKQKEGTPSNFEIIFITSDEDGEIRYRYGFSVNKKQVISEYLYAVKNVREIMYFSRNFQDINYTPNFKEGARGKASVRNNCSFLSVCAQNNGEISAKIIEYFREIVVLYGAFEPMYSNNDNIHPDDKDKIIKFLKNADIQITDYKTESIPIFNTLPDDELAKVMKKQYPDTEVERTLYGHIYYDDEKPIGIKYLDESQESAGTKKLFFFSSYILDALNNGSPLLIDEFDSSLHPLIVETVLKLFNSPITNPNNAQLIISCHAVNIMTNKLLRRDQIWFCEKDQYGATDLYSLVEYKIEEKESVRKDSSYNKNYLQGKYGAIPYIVERLLP